MDHAGDERMIGRGSTALIAAALIAMLLGAAPPARAAGEKAPADGGPGRAVPTLGNEHVPSPSTPHIPYNTSPPTSGPHLQWVAKWGVHKTPILRELQVHNLEDGGVMVQYHCATPCPDLVAKLTEIVRRYETQVILAPYPGMRTRMALTAWTRLDAFDDFDEARVVRFIRAYRGIEIGRASCRERV